MPSALEHFDSHFAPYYLQAFDDGNKRVSRLAANIPLMLYNCAPLSFMELSREPYTLAMFGIYEQTDCSLAVELFAATYRRSIRKYATLMKSFGLPDPFRIQRREALNQVVQRVVRERIGLAAAILELGLPADQLSTHRHGRRRSGPPGGTQLRAIPDYLATNGELDCRWPADLARCQNRLPSLLAKET